jgi:hypothetical protein
VGIWFKFEEGDLRTYEEENLPPSPHHRTPGLPSFQIENKWPHGHFVTSENFL